MYFCECRYIAKDITNKGSNNIGLRSFIRSKVQKKFVQASHGQVRNFSIKQKNACKFIYKQFTGKRILLVNLFTSNLHYSRQIKIGLRLIKTQAGIKKKRIVRKISVS